MSKFNKTAVRPASGTGPIATEPSSSGKTYEGAAGFARDQKSELFLLAVSNMVGEDAFYEKATGRDSRYVELIHQVAVADPQWMAGFLPWLRASGNMRSASLVGALEAARIMVAAGVPGSRQLVASVLQRADEPGEAVGYWLGRYGRTMPKPVKRGIADAVVRLYRERSLLKYDSDGDPIRFGDVIDLTHPSARDEAQGALFQHALDRRHRRTNPIPEQLRVLHARAELMAVPVDERRTILDQERLHAAGMTWEALAGWRQAPLDAAAWEAVVPSMGYFALLRNLRNFDEAGVSDDVAAVVAARLADPAEVAKSRLFPFRFLAAYRAVKSVRWSWALERALNASLTHVPALTGRTLILVDQSPSMFPGYHFSTPNKSDISLADQAKLFGTALALRAASPTLVQYGNVSARVEVPKGGSILPLLDQFKSIDGTDTYGAVNRWFDGHDRVVIVTDEQTRPGNDRVLAGVPVYTWNLSGYRHGHGPGVAHRHTFGGLTDHAFGLIPLLERGTNGGWPWDVPAGASGSATAAG